MAACETTTSLPGSTPTDSGPQRLHLEQLTLLDQCRLDSAVMMLVNYLLSASSKEMESML